VGVEGCVAVWAHDAEVVETVVGSDAVDVIEDESHPPAAPLLALPAELARRLLEARPVEAFLEMRGPDGGVGGQELVERSLTTPARFP